MNVFPQQHVHNYDIDTTMCGSQAKNKFSSLCGVWKDDIPETMCIDWKAQQDFGIMAPYFVWLVWHWAESVAGFETMWVFLSPT